MRASSRSRRALHVLGATAAATLICWTLIGSHAALAALLGFLVIGTIITVPGDLKSGEYDVFGFAIFALVLVIGLLAMFFGQTSATRFTKSMDVCGSSGCPDER